MDSGAYVEMGGVTFTRIVKDFEAEATTDIKPSSSPMRTVPVGNSGKPERLAVEFCYGIEVVRCQSDIAHSRASA